MRIVMALLLALLLGSYTITTTQAAVSSTLSQSDVDALVFMREEEKLAHDIYLALYARWQVPVFQMIATSEQTHMDAIKRLLDGYGIADPATGKAAGVFTNQDLQKLYTQLETTGKASLTDAYAVGAEIEEIDILDLKARTTATTPTDITFVYQRLTTASEQHLRSFVRQWEATTGQQYTPKHLDATTYAAIINGSNGNGGNGGNSGKGGNGGNGGNSGNGGKGGNGGNCK